MGSEDKPSSSASLSLSGLKQQSEKLWTDTVKEAGDKATAAIDQGIDVVSGVVRSTSAAVQQAADKASSQAQDVIGIGKAHLEQTEERALAKLKDGVGLVAAYQNESIAAAVVLAAVVLPGPRRFLYRHTLGRLRSEEAMYKSAQLRASSLAERLEAQNEELAKLQERLAAAQAEYQRGLANLKATSSQLSSLSKSVSGTEKSARTLVSDLRVLPSKAALQLRADVAQAASLAANQRSAIEAMVIRLAKQGV